MRFSKDLWPRKGGKITALRSMAPSQPQASTLSPFSLVNVFKHSPQQTRGVCPEFLTIITIVWLSALETHIYEHTPNLSFSSSSQTCAPFFVQKKILHTPFLTIVVNLSLTPDTITSVFDNPFTFWFCYLENIIQTCSRGPWLSDSYLSSSGQLHLPCTHVHTSLSLCKLVPASGILFLIGSPTITFARLNHITSWEFLPDYQATSFCHIHTVFLA